jgi:hypothetical protein
MRGKNDSPIEVRRRGMGKKGYLGPGISILSFFIFLTVVADRIK